MIIMDIRLIRHGMTEGNRYQRYIGITDEPLCEEGRLVLQKSADIPQPDLLFVSPMLRCRQTAQILFPNVKQTVLQELAEMNFGIFENRSWKEGLSKSPEYQKWLDSDCEDPIPGGESKQEFTQRCIRGFERALQITLAEDGRSAVFVVHGGTIMAILSRFAEQKRGYYEWHTPNGHGFAGQWTGSQLTHICEI